MIYELRIYKIAKGRMNDLHRIMTGTDVPLFKKHGVKTVGFWEVKDEDDPTFVYILGFEDETAKEKAWHDVDGSSEWKKVEVYLEEHGSPWEHIDSTLMTPTPYSPIQ